MSKAGINRSAVEPQRILFVSKTCANSFEELLPSILTTLKSWNIADCEIEFCDKQTLSEHIDGNYKDFLTVLVAAKDVLLDQRLKVNKNNFLIAYNDVSPANIYLSMPVSVKALCSVIKTGFDNLENERRLEGLSNDIKTVSRERKELAEIGIALSAEKDLEKLLSMVLNEGRKLGNCEAASLYLLLNPDSNKPELLFKLTQNSEINFNFKEKRFALTNQSLAGYVALTGKTLEIEDAYHLPDNLPYQFDNSFDNATGYRTKTLLTLAMRNHKGKIIGVLQFINSRDEIAGVTSGFSQERKSLLLSLASQAAVAIDNSQLIDNIQTLFEGFVSASVKAIESRDPVTSGHSFRVAEFTTDLAGIIDSSSEGIYRKTFFSKEQLREIRYASLLHDFGKVGVKEDVLLKSNKLQDSRAQYLELKIEWQKQLEQRKFYQKILNSKNQHLLNNWKNTEEYLLLQKKITKLNSFQKVLMQANRPSLLEAEVESELVQLNGYHLDDSFPYDKNLLSHQDFLSLSVTQGSLTSAERLEIQSHVVHTQNFLRAIPWTDELSAIPMIAGAHHEKLDGSGYPYGMVDEDIPVASKIMAVADIYDALTAHDRPYKKAVKVEMALDILSDEAKKGKLCHTMVNAFIESKIYQKKFLKREF